MRTSNKAKSQSVRNASEAIVLLQSLLMAALALAGFLAASTITACFNAVQNANSAAVLITDGKIVTENETVSVERATGIINNYTLVCVSGGIIAVTILAANLYRLWKKRK